MTANISIISYSNRNSSITVTTYYCAVITTSISIAVVATLIIVLS